MNPSLRRRKFAGCLHGTCCPSREWEVVLLLLHFRSIECKDQSKLCLCRNHGSGAHVLAYEPQQTNMTHLSSLKERQGRDTHATERTECPLVTVLPRQRDKALLARKALRRQGEAGRSGDRCSCHLVFVQHFSCCYGFRCCDRFLGFPPACHFSKCTIIANLSYIIPSYSRLYLFSFQTYPHLYFSVVVFLKCAL